MTIQQLRYFLACFELLSFKRTAEILYSSPSTVTRQIAALEEELGVQLFIRDTHRVFVTEEGLDFYTYARTALEQLDAFENKLLAAGKKTRSSAPSFRIACYMLDGIFRKIASALEQALPSERLQKHCSFYYPKSGGMVDAVLYGSCQVGVDSEAILGEYSEKIEKKLFQRSRFRIVVGDKSPLFGRDSVSTEEVIRDFGSYGCFIPSPLENISFRDYPLSSAADLKTLGGYTLPLLPRILPLLSDPEVLSNSMLLLPDELAIGYSKGISAVRFEDESIATDYMFFWKKGEDDPDLEVFLRLIERYTERLAGFRRA